MLKRGAQIADVIVDCHDPERLATLWSKFLGREIAGRRGPYVWLDRGGEDLGLGLQQVVKPTPGKNRIHLDVAADDLSSTCDRIIELGGASRHRASKQEES